jgi:hypothetical protein
MTTNSPTNTNQASEDELRAVIERYIDRAAVLAKQDGTSFNNKHLLKLDMATAIETIIRTEKLKLLAEIGEPKLEDAINEEKTPEGVKSTPKEPNDIFIILSPYFECKDCGELGCPYNPDVPAELAEAIDQYTQSKLKAFAGDIEKAIGEKEVSEYKQFDPNDEMILADQLIYDCRNDYRAELRESLKAIKERLIK